MATPRESGGLGTWGRAKGLALCGLKFADETLRLLSLSVPASKLTVCIAVLAEEKQFFTHPTWAPGVPRQRLPSQQQRHSPPDLPDFQKWRKLSPRVWARYLMGLRNFRTCAVPVVAPALSFWLRATVRSDYSCGKNFSGKVMKQRGSCDFGSSLLTCEPPDLLALVV